MKLPGLLTGISLFPTGKGKVIATGYFRICHRSGKKKKDLDGIAYNVPGQAMVTLTDGKKKLYEGELPITQFGVIEYLAPVLFNKNSTIKVYFDPNTGGLLKVDREEGK